MILHQYPGLDGIGSISPPCLRIEFALRFLDLDFRKKNHRSMKQVKKICPTGRLPVLEMEDELIGDSVRIMDRLETIYPESALWPGDPNGSVQDRLWEHFANDSIYWYGFYLRWVHPENSKRFMDALLEPIPFPMRWIVKHILGSRQRRRSMEHGTGGMTPEEVHDNLDRSLAMAEAGLKDGPFLQGRNHPGRGDLALAATLIQSGFRNTMPEATAMLRRRPRLMKHTEDVYKACKMEMPLWWNEERREPSC